MDIKDFIREKNIEKSSEIHSVLFVLQELGRFASSIIAAVIPYAQGEGHPEVKRKVSINIQYNIYTATHLAGYLLFASVKNIADMSNCIHDTFEW